MAFFLRGSRHTIYQCPLTNEHPEGVALLVSCRRSFIEFRRDGVIAETWSVIFEGEEELRTRVVATPLIGARVEVNRKIGTVSRCDGDMVAVQFEEEELVSLEQLKEAI
jgi:hypothetical protein